MAGKKYKIMYAPNFLLPPKLNRPSLDPKFQEIIIKISIVNASGKKKKIVHRESRAL